jgi:hypothetical protein
MKVILVERCADCPHRIPDAYANHSWCHGWSEPVKISNCKTFPRSCPLRDHGEEVG